MSITISSLGQQRTDKMLPPYYFRVFAGICVIVTYLFCQQLAKVINNQNGVDIQNYENLRSSGFGKKFD